MYTIQFESSVQYINKKYLRQYFLTSSQILVCYYLDIKNLDKHVVDLLYFLIIVQKTLMCWNKLREAITILFGKYMKKNPQQS